MHGATRSRLRIGRRTAGFQLSHICSSGHPTKKATNTALLRFSPRLGSCTVPGRCSRSDPNVFTKPAWRARGRIGSKPSYACTAEPALLYWLRCSCSRAALSRAEGRHYFFAFAGAGGDDVCARDDWAVSACSPCGCSSDDFSSRRCSALTRVMRSRSGAPPQQRLRLQQLL